MSHAGTYPSGGEEEEETLGTTAQNTDNAVIGQLVLQAAQGNAEVLLQHNSTPPGVLMPPAVTNAAPADTNAAAEDMPSPMEAKGETKRAAAGNLPPDPGKLNPARRKAIGAVCRYLRGEDVQDFEIATLVELIQYAKGNAGVCGGMIAVYNKNFPGDESEHLSASGIERYGEGAAAKKPRVAAPFDFAKYWAPGQQGTARLNAEVHHTKHQEDGGFACRSAEDYTEQARTFISQNSRNAQSQKGDENKTIICTYSRRQQTGLFLVRDSNSKILTFYVLTPATVRQYGTMTPEQYLATKVDNLDAVYTD